MTITTPRPGQAGTSKDASKATIDWVAVQSGLWVGKTNGEFAGMIEARWGDGFIATTRLGKNLGLFPTVDEAKASFAS